MTLSKLLKPRFTNYIPHVPTSKQQAFLWLQCRDALYGGAAGGGKSDALLMSALQYVDIPGYNAILIRDTNSNMIKPEGLLDRAHEWLSNTDAKWIGDSKQYVFPSGATLGFGYMDGPRDHFNYQGPAYQFIGLDEVVGLREHQAQYLFSRLRKLSPQGYIELLKILFPKINDETIQIYLNQYNAMPLRRRCGSNPPHRDQIKRGAWVKARFIDSKTRDKEAIFIPAKLTENPYLNIDDYKKSMIELDPITRRQLEDGDWDICAKGNMIDRSKFVIIPQPPQNPAKVVRFWDMAATAVSDSNKDPDWTVGIKMSRTTTGYIVVENMVRFRRNPGDTESTIINTAKADGKHVSIRMEQEGGSSGKTVIDYYMRKVFSGWDFKGKPAQQNKLQRFTPFANQVDAGNIYVAAGSWNQDFFDEMELFPDGEHDDIEDATSGAYEEIALGVHPRLRDFYESEFEKQIELQHNDWEVGVHA